METGDTAEAEEERKEEEDEFPAPPSLGDLEELAREQQEVPATPRTLRRADSLRQKMAARRIQRTWKHFYQVFASIFYQLYPSSTYSVQNPTKIADSAQTEYCPTFHFPCVRPFVTGVTSHISHIYKGIKSMLIIRGPTQPCIF